jgi:glucokinase
VNIMAASSPILVGDVGGTNTRLTLVRGSAHSPLILRESLLSSRDYSGLEEPVREFLRDASTLPRLAVFAVAGPVTEGRAELTNLGWVVEEDALRPALDLDSVQLVNDLVAKAYAIPHLGPDSLATLQAGRPVSEGVRAVVAPGTGLGMAFLTWDGHAPRAHPSEGGHVEFAPVGPLQDELLGYMRSRYRHVSGERVCSGRALPELYAFLKNRGGVSESADVAARMEAASDPTPIIVEAALHTPPRCPLARATVELFAAILAAEAGNMALRVFATGGVYLGGGLPRRILPILRDEAFLQTFRDKGRLSALLARIPLHVVIRPGTGLLGALHYALSGAAR